MRHATNTYHIKTETFKQQLEGGIVPWADLGRDNLPLTNLLSLADRLTEIETFVDNTEAYIHYGDSIDANELYPACYIGATDTIGMPYPVQFFATEDTHAIVNYYSILFHELAHWTGHPERLNRKLGNTYNSKAFALEELTAELTSFFVMNKLHITGSPIIDQAQYLDKWQKIVAMFGDDIYSLTTAELQANKACQYLFSLQNGPL